MPSLNNAFRGASFFYERNVREWVPSIVMAPLALYLCLKRGDYTLLDHAALLIHEAGHVLFGVFGNAAHLLGGTLMQVLLPLLLTLNFLRHHYRTGIQLSLFWLGHNLLNISVYAADAEAQQLHLLGGSRVLHDWNVILSQAGLLEFAPEVGSLFFLAAITGFGFAVLLPMLMWSAGD